MANNGEHGCCTSAGAPQLGETGWVSERGEKASRKSGRPALASATLGLAFATVGPLTGVASARGPHGSGGSGLGGTTPTTTSQSAKKPAATVGGPAVIAVPKNNPFTGRGMWIWEMQDTDRGNVAAIIAQAKQYKIRTLLIKSSDGTDDVEPVLEDARHRSS